MRSARCPESPSPRRGPSTFAASPSFTSTPRTARAGLTQKQGRHGEPRSRSPCTVPGACRRPGRGRAGRAADQIDALEAAIVRAVPANFRESKPEAMVRGEAKAKTGGRFPAADPRRCRRSCQDSWCRQRRCYPVAGSPQNRDPLRECATCGHSAPAKAASLQSQQELRLTRVAHAGAFEKNPPSGFGSSGSAV